MFAVAVMSLLFTFGGSTMLTLVCARLPQQRPAWRYLLVVILGVVVGGAGMLLFSGASEFALIGAAYGGVTACLWVTFHRLAYGRG